MATEKETDGELDPATSAGRAFVTERATTCGASSLPARLPWEPILAFS